MPHTIKIKYDSIDVLKFILSFLIIQIHTEFYFIWMETLCQISRTNFLHNISFLLFQKKSRKGTINRIH